MSQPRNARATTFSYSGRDLLLARLRHRLCMQLRQGQIKNSGISDHQTLVFDFKLSPSATKTPHDSR
ncbi:predicted protein [Plenodomus lingam JN3]|uniref:Predicted protein n=2 Tax=Leptosphaeria maculans TaxID=5022 RepID=E5A8J1_LEPMJ|nr:predicted protein [Plenodomus lingam JN3]CBX99936.1 predicted protein [Plenodomus lingam JN3]